MRKEIKGSKLFKKMHLARGGDNLIELDKR